MEKNSNTGYKNWRRVNLTNSLLSSSVVDLIYYSVYKLRLLSPSGGKPGGDLI